MWKITFYSAWTLVNILAYLLPLLFFKRKKFFIELPVLHFSRNKNRQVYAKSKFKIMIYFHFEKVKQCRKSTEKKMSIVSIRVTTILNILYIYSGWKKRERKDERKERERNYRTMIAFGRGLGGVVVKGLMNCW